MTASPFAPYDSPDAREARLDAAATALAAEVRVLGHSVEGRPIRAVRVERLAPRGAPTPVDPPRVLLCANIHGLEWISSYTALWFLVALEKPRPALRELRTRAEIWVVPCINPDGYARVFERRGKGHLSDLRANAHGVDLNRNFPLPAPQPWYALSLGGFATGSPDPTSPFFRGTAPLSEPETQAMAQLFADVPFSASVSLHSMMGTILPAHVSRRDHLDGYRRLGRALRGAQRLAPYRFLASRHLDWFTGEQEDFQHHRHSTWAVCLECFPVSASLRQHLRAPNLFWRFNPREPRRWLENDIPGLVAYYHAALDLGPPPR